MRAGRGIEPLTYSADDRIVEVTVYFDGELVEELFRKRLRSDLGRCANSIRSSHLIIHSGSKDSGG